MGHANDAVSPDSDPAYKWRAFAAIGVSFVTVVLSMTMVFVLLAPIADEFDVTLRVVGWVVIVESLIISALMLPMGRLADAVGRKRVHLIGLLLFGTGAVATGLAPTFIALIGGRVLMAIGSSMVQSVGTAMIVAVFPPEERGKAIGSQTTAVSIGGASGPIVGGFALQVTTWDVLFLLLAIPVAVSLIAGYRLLDEARVSFGAGMSDARFDGWGAATSGLGIAVLVITVSNPFGEPWLSPVILGGFGLAAMLFVTFVRIELAHESPMLHLRLFRLAAFRYGIVARIVGFASYSFVSLLLPIYLISVRGLSTGAAGGILFLTSFGMGLAAQIAGRASDRIGARPLTVSGFAAAAVCAGGFALVGLTTSLVWVGAVVFASGFALGTWNVPNNSSILGSVPPAQLGVTGAFTNLTRTIGTVLGQAVATAVVVGVMVSQDFDIPLGDIAETAGAAPAYMDGWTIGFLVVLGLSIVGLAMSWLAHRSRNARASPRPTQPFVFDVATASRPQHVS